MPRTISRESDTRRAIAATAGAALFAYWLPALCPVLPAVSRPLGVRHMLDGDGVAITFDDGPHPEGTPAVLSLLAAADTRATFFLVGEQVERRPALAARIVADGHEVGLHCQRNRNLMRLTPRQLRRDLDRATAAIEDACGRSLRLYRPPYGIFSAAALAEVHRRELEPLLWSRWGRDWSRWATPESVARLVIHGVGPGDVLLLHDADYYSAPDCWRATVGALPRVIAELRRRGLRPVVAS
ncbi:MAG: polysaccharide deacetylase family protein [Thermoleophilaceae bacterium]